MGWYINPKGMSKDRWLYQHGQIIPEDEARTFDYPTNPNEVLVCWVCNRDFTAAGIADTPAERDAFIDPSDPRPRVWFTVPKESLTDDVAPKKKNVILQRVIDDDMRKEEAKRARDPD